MDFSGFFSGLLGGLITTVVGGGIVVILGYRFVDKRLHLEDVRDRQRERDQDRATRDRQREENVAVVLKEVLGELESNARVLTTAVQLLRDPEPRVIAGGIFTVTMWPLVSAPSVFTTLSPEVLVALTNAYNRMSLTNQQNAVVEDFDYGATAIIVAVIAESSAVDSIEIEQTMRNLDDHKKSMRGTLLKSLERLKPFLDDAIDAVEGRLGIAEPPPAAERHYTPGPTFT